ncbi:hypothetical protein [uncultured Sunxiuqinia sp.]|uniref:hypothetical protein n=1 Tax=uncultured Sunxiuqinia sp. TaxID=1573825 RepID=UPI002AA7B628|nr:hypothetical protein [uncultured Sunxiuqinia sp.]
MNRLLILLLATCFLVFSLPTPSYSSIQSTTGDSTAVVSEQSSSTSNILIEHAEERDFNFMTVLRGLLGMLVLVGFGALLSRDRKNIPWKNSGGWFSLPDFAGIRRTVCSIYSGRIRFFSAIFSLRF